MDFEEWKEEQDKYNEERERRVKPQKRRGSTKRYALCIVGIILLAISNGLSRMGWNISSFELTEYDVAGMLLYFIALYMVIQGSYFWAKEKGRSGWWCLMGLIAPIGYIVLMNLRDDSALIKRKIAEGQIDTGFKEITMIPDNMTSTKSIHFCPSCGHKLVQNIVYCTNCGKKVSE